MRGAAGARNHSSRELTITEPSGDKLTFFRNLPALKRLVRALAK